MCMATTKVTAALSIFIGLLLFASSASLAYEEIAVTNGGTIRGAVKLAGNAPKLRLPQITKFQEVCQNVPNETVVIGPASGVRYAVVSLEGIAKGKPVDREAVHELDNNKCRFVP